VLKLREHEDDRGWQNIDSGVRVLMKLVHSAGQCSREQTDADICRR